MCERCGPGLAGGQGTQAVDVALLQHCDRAGCLLRAAAPTARLCAYHQGWFDAMDHIAKLAEALYDNSGVAPLPTPGAP